MKIEESVAFRSCKPSDIERAVPLIYSSGPDAFDYVFKSTKLSAKDFLSFAFKTKGGEFSYDNHTAMELAGELIGIGSVFSGNQAASFSIHDATKILRLYKVRGLRIMARGLSVEKIIKLPKKNETALAHIAIDKKHRSKGYGRKLMEHLMSVAPIKSDGYFVLDVSELNPRAKALYERLGFRVQKLNTSSLKNKSGFVANHYRMIMQKLTHGVIHLLHIVILLYSL